MLSNHLPRYYSWKSDLNSLGTNALQQKWYHKSLYAFPPFALIHKVLKKVKKENVPSIIIVTPTWQTQSCYPELLHLSMRNPIILPLEEDLLKGSQNQKHRLIQNRTMQLAVGGISGSVWQRKQYQKGLQTLLFHQEVKVPSQHTHWPGISGLAGVLIKMLIQFAVMRTGSWTFLPFCLSQDMNIGQHVHIGQQPQLCITILREDLFKSTRRSVLLLQVCSIIDHISLNITLSGMFNWCWII